MPCGSFHVRLRECILPDVQLETATNDCHHFLDEGFVVGLLVVWVAAMVRIITNFGQSDPPSPTLPKNGYPTLFLMQSPCQTARSILALPMQHQDEPLLYGCVGVLDLDLVDAGENRNEPTTTLCSSPTPKSPSAELPESSRQYFCVTGATQPLGNSKMRSKDFRGKASNKWRSGQASQTSRIARRWIKHF